jgi:hypothetical protein
VCVNPSISLVSKVKQMDKVDRPDADKSEWIKLEFLMDPDNPTTKYSQNFVIFKDRCPDNWIKRLLIDFRS